MIEFKPGRYQHYKGKLYAGFFLIKDGDNPEKRMVLYMPLYETHEQDKVKLCTRTKENFLETLARDGSPVQRFTWIGELTLEDLDSLSKEFLKIE